MFEGMISWCNYKGYRWKIVGECFYWQTNYQTGMINANGETFWLDQDYFNKFLT